MDTRSGRIYDPDEMQAIKDFERRGEIPTDPDLARSVEAFKQGHLVPVSDEVARIQLLGQKVDKQRKAKRKAQRAARKKNRGN